MTSLPDVNVLVALAWPNHIHHGSARRWFGAEQRGGWATCPITESGFVRVSANRRVVPTATTVARAIVALTQIRALVGHEFWADDVSLTAVPEIDPDRITGYRLVTDAHLLALAVRRGGRIVTFDPGVAAMGDETSVLLLHA